MSRQQHAAAPLEDRQVPVPSKLAAWWASFMFLYVYVDILGLYMPGVIDDIRAGIVWELEVSQGWAIGALTLMAIPISMVALSTTLPARANRRANLVVAPVYLLVSVAHAVGESWTFYFTLAVGLEVVVLAMIVRCAWTWPRTTSHTAVGQQSVRMQRV